MSNFIKEGGMKILNDYCNGYIEIQIFSSDL